MHTNHRGSLCTWSVWSVWYHSQINNDYWNMIGIIIQTWYIITIIIIIKKKKTHRCKFGSQVSSRKPLGFLPLPQLPRIPSKYFSFFMAFSIIIIIIIITIISSVRSSYSHPDLLVIQHPTTFSDHTGPQHWTFTFWATTAI